MEEGKVWDFSYRMPTNDDIKALIAFLPFLERNQSENIAGSKKDFNETQRRFFVTLRECGFLYGFDWAEWLESGNG